MSARPLRPVYAALLASCLAAQVAAARPGPKAAEHEAQPPALTAEVVNGASLSSQGQDTSKKTDGDRKREAGKGDEKPDPLIVKAQILLDRAHFYPGAIDGLLGENYKRALSAFAVAQGLPATQTLTPEVWDKLQATSDKPAVTDYTITDADTAGPYVDKIPPKMEQQADLKAMDYTNPREMLAERFHMSRALVTALNPDKPLDKAGTSITVAAVDPMGTDKPKAKDLPYDPKVERIEVDKTSRDVRAFGADGKLLAYYPASIGSTEKPAPSGDTKVKGVAFDPDYTYNPKYAFKGVKTKHKFTIQAGPNNPVGLVWIDLAIPSYGIHGTPEPEKVGKTESHGCIRLTNWNARDLAAHVARGAKVSFKDD
ncbi:Lipoprotein-anchoring transpeptidase ErfK/SrfK [Methylobacterium phyllostachyos]|uniref:Lipoprotein-anchoring transpeptidase ErfK/SrfK n=1 Tax=Methylobacterium phyllostachyos TaxID=582672 RepID=A0A1G9Z669_9HYPH|nr:L,D-transpeptidase [Methylobacterium phyllostachyos]SDN16525.1 Lipoprotein-anchoring transpeptidase ErfK/SrfK [Methylobacterium phyllostachyos]